eukprot:TRINITY_DN17135_c0_g1_i1.p1 TRINITY_DN17135_c0_g1~~TRINITY_DN17135_c0_g1_i1.p1  ORF type:complete len:471 (+),score=154.12 TRINITY_DN17135_c0_g1_i1:135-1415(+)
MPSTGAGGAAATAAPSSEASSTLPCLALAPIVALMCIAFISATFTMPHPYDGLRPLSVSKEYLDAVPGFPIDMETSAVKLNDELKKATRLFEGSVQGVEGISTSPDGTALFMLDKYGYLHIAELAHAASTAPPRLFQNITYVGPGRPLGFHVTPGNHILVCDSLKGLLDVDVSQVVATSGGATRVVSGGGGVSVPIRILANQAPDGSPINYANDLDVCPATQKIFFSSSTAVGVALNPQGYYDTFQSYLLNALRGDASGRIFSFDNSTQVLELVHEGVWYANGVAASADGKYVYFAETSALRIRRKCLVTGVVETVVDGLPGYPDGISRSPKGDTFWVSLVAPASPSMLLLPYPRMRLLASFFVGYVRYIIRPWGVVVEISEDGRILRTLADPRGEKVSFISSTNQVGNRLYFGNLVGNFVSYFDL